ncbi:MAG: hypothetical protein EXR80_05245 [Methylococcales bacterium]|nr:hypothetical protein [Methylococcales bacterium]
MIGAMVMIFVALWIYQSAKKAKVGNVMIWAGGAALVFFITQFVLIEVNVNLFDLGGTKTESKVMLSSGDETCVPTKTVAKEGEKDGDMGQFKNSSCSEVHGGDRQDEERFTGFGGLLKSLYFELFPSILSFFAIAFLRIKLITKEAIAVTNLFSGIKDMFISIKQSFKASASE